MPTHVYRPLRNPPNWRDRLMVHTLDHAVGAAAGVMGLLLTASAALPAFSPSKSLDHMPWYTVLPTGLALAVGGVLAIVGLQWWGNETGRGWALEKLGWRLTALGLVVYAISVMVVFPTSITGWLLALVLGAGALLRSVSLSRIEEATRQVLGKQPRGDR